MVKILFNTNYPRQLTVALNELHGLQTPREFVIEHVSKVEEGISFDRSVVFLFDHSKKNIHPATQLMCDSGYRVFAFKLNSIMASEIFNPFKLGMTVVKLWPEVLEKINTETEPFVFSYTYKSTKLKREK